MDTGTAQQGCQGRAEPARVADVRSADRVRHAGQGHVVFFEPVGEQFVEGDLERAVHHAVDLQLPVPRVHTRDDECRVHPVELRGRGEERTEAADLRVCRGGRFGQRGGRRGQYHLRARLRDVVTPRDPLLAAVSGHQRARRRTECADHEAAPLARLRGRLRLLERQDGQPPQHQRRGDSGGQ